MNDKQREAIKNMDNYKLLDIYNSYYTKFIRVLVADEETTSIYDGLRNEILTRMEKGAQL